MSTAPKTIFVAMPYTDLGEHAKWRKPQEVWKFYDQVCKAIAKKMRCPFKLHIEKDAPKSGLVIMEMSQAIHSADARE